MIRSLRSYILHYSISFVPSLGQYSPEKCHPPQEKRAPCYTFKTRTKYSFEDPTPSPNSYSLPPLIGPKVVSAQSAPAYSLSARSAIGGFSEDLKKVRKLRTNTLHQAWVIRKALAICVPNTYMFTYLLFKSIGKSLQKMGNLRQLHYDAKQQMPFNNTNPTQQNSSHCNRKAPYGYLSAFYNAVSID